MKRERWWITAGRFLRAEYGELIVAIIVVAILAFGVKLAEFYGWTGSAEGLAADIALAASASGGEDDHIVAIEIDEIAYSSVFQSKSPLTAEKLVDILEKLNAWSPRVIGVDLVTDSEDYVALRNRWQRLPAVWAAAGSPPPGARESFASWVQGHEDPFVITPTRVLGTSPLPDVCWAVPIFPREADRAVRRFPREVLVRSVKQREDPPETEEGLCASERLSNEIAARPTWARMVARQYCGGACRKQDAPEILIAYGNRLPAPIRLCEIPEMQCPGTAQIQPTLSPDQMVRLKRRAAGNIVLLGGTFGAARDQYDTPLGRTSGLMLNAYAVRAELSGGISELYRPYAVALDLLIGLCIAVAFSFHKWRGHHRRESSGAAEQSGGLRPAPMGWSLLIGVYSMLRMNTSRLRGRHAESLRPRPLNPILWLFWLYFWVAAGAVVVSLILAEVYGRLWVSWFGVILVLLLTLLADVYREARHQPAPRR